MHVCGVCVPQVSYTHGKQRDRDATQMDNIMLSGSYREKANSIGRNSIGRRPTV